VIIDALNHAAEIRKIYKDVSGSVKPDDWYPLQVICESCGKIGTTQVTGWDGANVMYECKKNMVKWAQGCGNSGTISPFDGRAKLPWKVEWPAKWKVMKVDIEGAGKDHSAAGGSRQIGARISEEIFKYPNPFDIPYEFFNFKGKKMSASKGLGASAKEMADLLPPTQLKFLMIRKQANHPIDFDPEGATIPNLFDEFDRLSDHYFGRVDVPDPQLTRTFALANINFPNPPLDLFRPRFSLVSFIVQMPHLDLIKEVESIKGKALTEEEKSDLSHRAETAKRWLERYASPAYLYRISSQLPDGYSIDGEQRKSLQALVHALSSSTLPWEGVKIHEAIHHVKESVGIAPKKLFEPLYMLFLGRSSGPQLGWFLGTMQRKDVIGKIQSMVGTESI
jgi:lysyl-tRNA synthetase class 1